MSTQQAFPAGWYPDPHGSPSQRFWNGAEWTSHFTAPAPQVQFVAPQPVVSTRDPLTTAGWVTAILMPIVGFIIGIIMAARGERYPGNSGVAIIIVAVVCFVVWTGIIAGIEAASYESSSSYDY